MLAKPWEKSTGPKTAAGKARVADNGRKYQKGDKSIRQLRAELSDIGQLTETTADLRRALDGSI